MKRKPEELLEELRGTKQMCACGKTLVPSEGGTGVTHETYEDEDHHYEFFGGMKIEIN